MRNANSAVRDIGHFMTHPGSRIHVRYEARFNGSGVSLAEAGREDIQERINAYAPYTDLNYMLHRLSVGDTSVLARSAPMYGDFSVLPDNPTDMVNLLHRAEGAFAELDAETKRTHNNDYRVWLASLFTPRQQSDTAVAAPDPVPTPALTEKEVKNESEC